MDLFPVSNCDGDLDTTVDKVMKNIFTSCDTEKSNKVHVLDLINFIQPFMNDNVSELQELQVALDPNNENPPVSSEQFYKAMGEWTKKIKDDDTETPNCSFNEINPSDLDHLDPKDLPYCQSTPRNSFGHHLIKGYQGSLNTSNISTYSLNGTNNLSIVDKTCFEEKIKELEHQVHKSNAELHLAKQQLAASEDQNDQLQSEMKKMQKQLLSEHQLAENLAKIKKEGDDLREELQTVKNRNQHVERQLNLAEKDNANLKTWIQQLEVESLKWEKKYEDIVEKEQETVKHVLELKTELACKEEEISGLVKMNTDLNIKMKEQKDLINHFKNTTDMLKQERAFMEQKFKELLSSNKDSVLSQLKSCLNNSIVSLDVPATNGNSNLSLSSDEDIYTKLHIVNNCIPQLPHESLQSEICNAIQKTDVDNRKDEENPVDSKSTNKNYTANSYCSAMSSNSIDKSNYVSLIQDKDNYSVLLKEKELLEKDLSSQIGKWNELQNELDKVKTELKAKDVEISKLKGKIDEITYEKNNLYEKLKDEIENGKKLEEIYEKFRKYESTIDSFNKKDLNYRVTIEELAKELNSTKNSNVSLNSEVTGLQSVISDLKETASRLDFEYEEKCSENDALKTELDSKIKEVLDLQEEMSHNVITENLQDHLQKDLKVKEAEIFDLQEKLRTEEDIKNRLWQNLKEYKTDLKQKEIKEQELIIKRNELEEQLKEEESKRESLKIELESVKNEKTVFENETISLNQKCQLLEVENSKSREKITNIENDNRILNEQSQCLRHELQNLKSFEKEITHVLCGIKVIFNNLPAEKLHVLSKNEVDLIQSLDKNSFNKILDVLSVLLNKSDDPQDNKAITYNKQSKIINKLEERIWCLQSNIDCLKTTQEALESKCELSEDTNKALISDYSKIFEEIVSKHKLEYNQNKTDLENKIVDLSEELKLGKEQYRKIHVQLEAVLRDKSVVEHKLSQAEKLIIQLSSEKLVVQSKVAELRKTVCDLSSANENLTSGLHKTEAEFDEINAQLANSKELVKQFENKCNSVYEKLNSLEKHLCGKRRELCCATDLILDKCKHLFKSDIWQNKLQFIEKMEPPRTKYIEFLIDKEINKLNNQIKLTTKIMELIAARFSQDKTETEMQTDISGDFSDNISRQSTYRSTIVNSETQTDDSGVYSMRSTRNVRNSEVQTEVLDLHSTSAIKPLKKFTLRPSSLAVSQPASPDSPSVELFNGNKVCSVSLFKSAKEVSANNNSPDSVVQSRVVFSNENVNESSNQTENHDEMTMANVPDEFLERLDLLEESPRKHLSKKELEEKFTALALMLTIESNTNRTKYRKQKELMKNHQNHLKQILSEIIKLLDGHICADKVETILPALDQLVLIRNSLDSTFESAEQCGVLQMEARTIKCWNLVTNYVAMLKKDLDEAGNTSLPSTKSESPLLRNDAPIKRCVYTQTGLPKLVLTGVKNESYMCLPVKERSQSATFCGRLKPIGLTVGVALMFAVGLVYYVHWKCLNSGLRHPICPLDIIFEKIFQPKMNGRSPY